MFQKSLLPIEKDIKQNSFTKIISHIKSISPHHTPSKIIEHSKNLNHHRPKNPTPKTQHGHPTQKQRSKSRRVPEANNDCPVATKQRYNTELLHGPALLLSLLWWNRPLLARAARGRHFYRHVRFRGYAENRSVDI